MNSAGKICWQIQMETTGSPVRCSPEDEFDWQNLLADFEPHSLTNTEITKNIPQDFIGGYLSRDLAQIMQNLPNILRQKITRQARI